VLSRPILDKFALHYQTGKPMPQALVAKIEQAATFNQGYATVEYLSSAIVDMRLHTCPTRARSTPRRSSATRWRRSARRARWRCGTACRSSTTCSPATRTRPATTATCGAR
jgi:Zn-dependent oligopeptidase